MPTTAWFYFIARFRSLREDDQIPAVLRIAIIPVVVVSVALVIVMLVFAVPLAHVLLSYRKESAGSLDVIVASLRGLALLVPFAALENVLLGATRGYREMQPTVVIDRVGVSIVQLLAVLVAAATGGLSGNRLVWALPYLPATIAAWWWLRRIPFVIPLRVPAPLSARHAARTRRAPGARHPLGARHRLGPCGTVGPNSGREAGQGGGGGGTQTGGQGDPPRILALHHAAGGGRA